MSPVHASFVPSLSWRCLDGRLWTMRRPVSFYSERSLSLYIYPHCTWRHRRVRQILRRYRQFWIYGKYHNGRSLFLRYLLVLCRRNLTIVSLSFHLHESVCKSDQIDGFDFFFGLIPTGNQKIHSAILLHQCNVLFFFSQKVLHFYHDLEYYNVDFNDFWSLDVSTQIY